MAALSEIRHSGLPRSKTESVRRRGIAIRVSEAMNAIWLNVFHGPAKGRKSVWICCELLDLRDGGLVSYRQLDQVLGKLSKATICTVNRKRNKSQPHNSCEGRHGSLLPHPL